MLADSVAKVFLHRQDKFSRPYLRLRRTECYCLSERFFRAQYPEPGYGTSCSLHMVANAVAETLRRVRSCSWRAPSEFHCGLTNSQTVAETRQLRGRAVVSSVSL